MSNARKNSGKRRRDLLRLWQIKIRLIEVVYAGTHEAHQLPGVCLAGARHREGFPQRKSAGLTCISQRHIFEMETGKRTIGKERAKGIGHRLPGVSVVDHVR